MDAIIRSAEEARANAVFDALLNATARPGTVHALPEPGIEPVIDALIDRECVVYAADPLVIAALMRTGARLGEADAADYVFCSAAKADLLAGKVRLGSNYYPDDGATLVVTGQLDIGPACRLTGPGIESVATLRCEGLDEAFWRQRNSRIRYPMGFDVIIVDECNVAALPRSTQVEVF